MGPLNKRNSIINKELQLLDEFMCRHLLIRVMWFSSSGTCTSCSAQLHRVRLCTREAGEHPEVSETAAVSFWCMDKGWMNAWTDEWTDASTVHLTQSINL